jgi:hypothetical protein
MKLRKLPICGTVVSEYGTIANEPVTFVTHTRNGSVTEFEHSVRISVTDFASSARGRCRATRGLKWTDCDHR